MAIVIKAELKMGPALAGVQRLQNWLEKARLSAASLNAELAAVAGNAKAAGMAVGGMRAPRSSGSGGGSPRTPRVSKPPMAFANDPASGAAYYARAAAMGDPTAGRLFAMYNRQAKTRTNNRNAAQGFLDPSGALIKKAIASTRFGKGGGQVLGHVAQSLMGTPGGAAILQGLMGPGAAAGGGLAGGGAGLGSIGTMALAMLRNPLTIVVAGLLAFGKAVQTGSAVLNQYNGVIAQGGARGAGAALGFSNAGINLAGIGAGLSGYGAARLGLNPNTDGFGDVDYNARGIRAMDSVRYARNRQESRRNAIFANDPSLARVFDWNKGAYNAIRNDQGPNSGFARSRGQLDGSVARFQTAWDKLVSTISGPTVKLLSEGFDLAARGLEGFNRAIEWYMDHLPKVLRDALGWDDKRERAIDRNTKALDDNTNAYREGTYGGGPRATGATPSDLRPAVNPGYGNADYGLI